MLEMIWFLPCDWSVPVFVSVNRFMRGGFFRVLTFSEDDDGRRLAAERHFGEEFLYYWELEGNEVVDCVVSGCGGAGNQTVLFWG